MDNSGPGFKLVPRPQNQFVDHSFLVRVLLLIFEKEDHFVFASALFNGLVFGVGFLVGPTSPISLLRPSFLLFGLDL